MKKLLFLGACLVASASQPAMAQTGGHEVVVMKVVEYAGHLRIAISRGEGKTEVIEAEGGGSSKKDLTLSSEACQKVITRLYQEGYSLKGTFGTEQSSLSTLVFVKD